FREGRPIAGPRLLDVENRPFDAELAGELLLPLGESRRVPRVVLVEGAGGDGNFLRERGLLFRLLGRRDRQRRLVGAVQKREQLIEITLRDRVIFMIVATGAAERQP